MTTESIRTALQARVVGNAFGLPADSVVKVDPMGPIGFTVWFVSDAFASWTVHDRGWKSFEFITDVLGREDAMRIYDCDGITPARWAELEAAVAHVA